MQEAQQIDTNKEFSAIQTVYKALETLDADAQKRVMKYIMSLLSLDVQAKQLPAHANDSIIETNSVNENSSGFSNYNSFAELYDAANPQTGAEKALVAGVWLQEVSGQESFSSQTLHGELKNLGYGVANITSALENLREQKPSLMLQLRKSGSSQQSRKTYKVTVQGVREVAEMINRSH